MTSSRPECRSGRKLANRFRAMSDSLAAAELFVDFRPPCYALGYCNRLAHCRSSARRPAVADLAGAVEFMQQLLDVATQGFIAMSPFERHIESRQV